MAKKKSKTSSSKSKKAERARNEYLPKDILENVLATPMSKNVLTNDQKIEAISQKFKDIMEIMGLDLSDDSLQDTPKRVAKMYVNEIFSGLDIARFPKMTLIDNKMQYDQMICISGISALSFCEHHFLTIDGRATVAYIPNKKVIGLSKINRIVKFFSRRPQVQERLTKQIADCLEYVLETEHVAVYIDAKHYCVIARGIEDISSSTVTTEVRGHFRSHPHTREEFLRQCKRLP
jgi:GTP cyclohydrolase IA